MKCLVKNVNLYQRQMLIFVWLITNLFPLQNFGPQSGSDRFIFLPRRKKFGTMQAKSTARQTAADCVVWCRFFRVKRESLTLSQNWVNLVRTFSTFDITQKSNSFRNIEERKLIDRSFQRTSLWTWKENAVSYKQAIKQSSKLVTREVMTNFCQ